MSLLSISVSSTALLISSKTLPNISSSYLILAAHSGNSYVGFFHHLSSLVIGDEVYIYYQKQKYTYIIDDIYSLPKNQEISFKKNNYENILVLTTCGMDNSQLVIVAKMFKEM